MSILPIAPILPRERALAVYWIPAVGIGKTKPYEWVTVPLKEVSEQPRLPDGRPQTTVVFLGFAHLTRNNGKVTPPFLKIGDGLLRVLETQPGEEMSRVERLRRYGTKVVLSVQGHGPDDDGLGWDHIPSSVNEEFANWMKTEVIEKYGLDGIDIDDEWSGGGNNPQGFVDTLGVLRYYLPASLISKALDADTNYFQVPVSSAAKYNVGAYLARLLDFGCTMTYGSGRGQQIQAIADYHNIHAGGQNVGMNWDQLCIGVQAGLPQHVSGGTPLAEVSALAQWVAEPLSSTKKIPPILGMMLFTFSQDILQFTRWPQNQERYKYPNPGDHEWQKAIIAGMWGGGA